MLVLPTLTTTISGSGCSPRVTFYSKAAKLLLVPLILLTLCFSAESTFAQGGVFVISQEPSGCCGIEPPTEGVISLHVVQLFSGFGIQGVRLSAPKPDCFAATYLSDTPVWPATFGNSQTDVQINYGACIGSDDAPFHVLTINFLVESATSPCCFYRVLTGGGQAGNIETTNCDGVVEKTAGSVPAIINPNSSCPCPHEESCPAPVAVEASSWGAIKALYWE